MEIETPETPLPKFKVGDKVKLPKTRMGNLTDSKVVVYAKQKNQDFLFVTTVLDDITLYLSEDKSPSDERDTEMFFTNLDNIELYEEMPEETPKIGLPSTSPETWNGTFKVGDKVKVRWDFSKDLGGGASKVEYNSIENNFTITKIDKQQATPYKEDKNGNNIGGFMRKENPSGYLYVLNNGQMWEGKDLELLDFKEKNPEETPYEKIDFLSPSTEELDTVIKSMQYNSDGLTLLESRKATVFIGETALSVNFQKEKGNNLISIVKKDLTGKLFESPIITNESLLEIQEIYYTLLKQIVDYLETKADEKTPDQTPYEKINFLKLTTEEENTIGAVSDSESESVTIDSARELRLLSNKKDLKGLYITLLVWFTKKPFENRIEITGVNAPKLFESKIITNESLEQIAKIYENLLLEAVAFNEGKTPETPEPKFKVGDRVKLPTTKNGTKLVGGMSNVWDDARKIGQDYLVVNEVFDNSIVLDNELGKFGDYFDINLDKIELYTTKQPEPKFKVGDRVTFNKVPFATFRVMEKLNYNSARGKFVYKLANEDGKSSFSSGYEDEINLIVDETPTDCDADPSLIVSGQVKAFYDLNKNRIDKLNSKFSCKIIKALVSLSEYEKCGSPSSATVTKAKTDLLSKISKLKV